MIAGCQPPSTLEFPLARPKGANPACPTAEKRSAENHTNGSQSPLRKRPCRSHLAIALGGGISDGSIRGRNELAVAELIIDVAPADGRSCETRQPDQKSHGIPERN